LLAERGIEVDHTSIYRWVQRFTPLLANAARPCRHAIGNRWQIDETYIKVTHQGHRAVALRLYRAIDEFGQVIDVRASPWRDTATAREFSAGPSPPLCTIGTLTCPNTHRGDRLEIPLPMLVAQTRGPRTGRLARLSYMSGPGRLGPAL
jgi:DDE domain